MDNKYKDLFDSLNKENQFRPAIHMAHENIDDNASELLSGILGRTICAEGNHRAFEGYSGYTVKQMKEEAEHSKVWNETHVK